MSNINKIEKHFIFLGLLVFCWSCTPSGKAVEPGTGSTAGKEQSSNGNPDKKTTDPKVEEIPAKFKHDAYSWNGFDRLTPLNYDFIKFKGGKAEVGTQVSTLKSISESGVKFSVERTGSLESIGQEDLEVRPDGIYLMSTSLGSPSAPAMLMPATIKPGVVWNYDYKLTTSGGTEMVFKGKARAEREEKLKTKNGEFDTMLVTETADMTSSGQKQSVSSKTWYAKGIGVVQMRMEVKDGTGKIVNASIDLGGKVGN